MGHTAFVQTCPLHFNWNRKGYNLGRQAEYPDVRAGVFLSVGLIVIFSAICLIMLTSMARVPAMDQGGRLLIFPGAEGFGITSRAGRGGDILHVTNLNDAGSGSLRAAIEADGPRIIVFDVGGVIHLASPLRIDSPYCTIAGQTAPAQGILIRDFGMKIRTHDVLVQHLAIRPGDEGPGPYGTLDGLNMNGSGTYNVVIDHCSISWGIDENLDTWKDVHNITISNCIISECLRDSRLGHPNSKGYLAGRRNKNIAFLGNLMAHNEKRNLMIYGGTSVLIVNNVFYNAGAGSFAYIGDGWNDGPPTGVFVGNVFMAGPGTTADIAIMIGPSPDGTQVYEAFNYFDAGSIRGGRENYFVPLSPISLAGITCKIRKNEVLNSVLAHAGARPGNRDAVDERIANPVSGEVVSGKGAWVDSVNGKDRRAPGGWPHYPRDYRYFEEGPNPHGDDNGNGYTNIEEILFQMALQVEGT